MSDDPRDFTYLTPGHFLIGEAMTSIPEPNVLDDPFLLTHRYRAMLKKSSNFLGHWKRSYFHSLQHRQKWLTTQENLQVGRCSTHQGREISSSSMAHGMNHQNSSWE